MKVVFALVVISIFATGLYVAAYFQASGHVTTKTVKTITYVRD